MAKTFLIFFGPPGSGKGTQADLLAQKLRLPVAAIGELLRHEEEVKSAIGKKVKPLIDAGKLAPNEIIETIIDKFFRKAKVKLGAIFDGYPRKKDQLELLKKRLAKIAGNSDKICAVLIDVKDQEVEQRLGGRRACDCGAVYHLKYNPPKIKNICDLCGKKLYVRQDDKPKLIADRLKIYHQEIKPMLDYWKKAGRLIVVDGGQSINDVQADIINALKERKTI